MSPLTKYPVTPATKFLKEKGTEFTQHLYDYKKSGAVAAAQIMNVDEHGMIKTLVLETNERNPFIVLMHGEKEISLKELARQLGAKNVSTCSQKDAQRHTGYMVGGISPFGTRRKLPIYVEKTILDLPFIYINGGRRGFILGVKPEILLDILDARPVHVAR